MRFIRKYNYQRAKYEDLKVICEQFALIYNVKVKYNILNNDLYNFNETGFIIGIIIATIVVTTLDSRSSRAKQAQPSNREQVIVIQGVNALG